MVPLDVARLPETAPFAGALVALSPAEDVGAVGEVVVDPIEFVLGSGEKLSGRPGEFKQEVSVPLNTRIFDEFAAIPRLGMVA